MSRTRFHSDLCEATSRILRETSDTLTARSEPGRNLRISRRASSGSNSRGERSTGFSSIALSLTSKASKVPLLSSRFRYAAFVGGSHCHIIFILLFSLLFTLISVFSFIVFVSCGFFWRHSNSEEGCFFMANFPRILRRKNWCLISFLPGA